MKKRIFILGSLLLAMLVFNLPGFAAVDTSTTDEGKPQDSISQEMKSIPLEVPALIDKIRLTGRVQALWKVWGEHDDQAVGLGDILENGKTALIFKTGEVEDLFFKMKEITANKKISHQIGKSAKKLVEKELSWEKYAQAMVKIYREVL